MSEQGEILPPSTSLTAGKGQGRKMPPIETRFQPGQSGNPGGKTQTEAEIRRLAQGMSVDALKRIQTIAMETDDERAALVGLGMILDRAFGKPKEIPPSQDDQAGPPDLSSLAGGDLAALRKIVGKLMTKDKARG